MIKIPAYYERAREIAARAERPAGYREGVVSNKKADRGELYIYDDIGASMFSDGITAKDVATALDTMKGVKHLDIYVNSPGGDVFEGVAILSLLDRNPASKTVYVDGVAASIASVIAMAGNEIVMHPAATMMIHDPYSGFIGNAGAMREMADLLDKLAGTLVAAYVARTGIDAKEVRDLMLAETWMDAEDAVKRGFANRIAKAEQPAAQVKVQVEAHTDTQEDRERRARMAVAAAYKFSPPGKAGTGR